MVRKYNLDENIAEGDPLHPETHEAIAEAVNDLDDRTVDIETDLTTRLSPAELSRTIADAIASTGGGTVTDDTYLWIYDYVNNVMPAPPSEAPAGCKLVEAIAPIAPTFAPWMGIGPGKVFTRLYIAEG